MDEQIRNGHKRTRKRFALGPPLPSPEEIGGRPFYLCDLHAGGATTKEGKKEREGGREKGG